MAGTDELEDMEMAMTRGLEWRRYARWLSRLSKGLRVGGVAGVALMSTVAYLPALHAGQGLLDIARRVIACR